MDAESVHFGIGIPRLINARRNRVTSSPGIDFRIVTGVFGKG